MFIDRKPRLMTVTLDKSVEDFVATPRQLFIDGRWVDAASGKTGYLDSGYREGAHTVVGGARHGDQGYFVQPTVLIGAHPSMKVVRKEIFGPVVVASPFSDLDDLAAQANSTGSRGTHDRCWRRRRPCA
ncbi:aldehyde dehydrogenase family protein [Nonomuraea sp. NPDC049158]|uniref:aldehyde dehydrogenase family protein n=1 Tax=Nonomuraea sp. NPDC049158 TaxID=3155649 RepID=UPI0033CD620F